MNYWGEWKYTMKIFGKPRVSAKYLEEKFQEFNSMYFKSELKHCTIKFDTLNLHRCFGLYCCKKYATFRYGLENPVLLLTLIQHIHTMFS